MFGQVRYDMKIKAKPVDLYASHKFHTCQDLQTPMAVNHHLRQSDHFAGTMIRTDHRARVSNIKGNCVPEFGNNDSEHSTP
ncbi:hypothetical protein FF1_016065 [Malus domestica]